MRPQKGSRTSRPKLSSVHAMNEEFQPGISGNTQKKSGPQGLGLNSSGLSLIPRRPGPCRKKSILIPLSRHAISSFPLFFLVRRWTFKIMSFSSCTKPVPFRTSMVFAVSSSSTERSKLQADSLVSPIHPTKILFLGAGW